MTLKNAQKYGIRPVDPATIRLAAALLQDGGLVAFPTETVYGLAANAQDDAAIDRLYRAKGRPRHNPLIVHLAAAEDAAQWAEINSQAQALMAAFWPGPLTLVLPRQAACSLPASVSAGLPTIALRVPDHPVAQQLLHACRLPLAAPSANPAGRLSPTRATHVATGLGAAVDLILQADGCAIGVESTVIAALDDGLRLLRPGGLTRTQIEAEVGPLTLSNPTTAQPLSPGQLRSHYAPMKKLRLNACQVSGDEALIAFGHSVPSGAAVVHNLSQAGDLAEAARNLYAYLALADQSQAATIAVMPIPSDGIGAAINDRLNRAAADA